MKHLKNQSIITLLFITFSLSSCFNIVEEITLRKDGSGSYRFSIDGKEIMGMAKGLGKNMTGSEIQADSAKVNAPADSAAIDKFAGLKRMKGIHNVVEVNDKTAMAMGVSFDFEHLADLDQVMDSIGNVKALGSFGVGRHLKLEGKNVTRETGNSIRNILAAMMHQQAGEKGGPDMSSSASFMRMMFGSMTFTQIYHFPDRKIKKCNRKGAEISKDKHSLTIIEKPFKDNQDDKKSASSDLLIRLK